MSKSYEFADNAQLSPHFNISEFRCKCGKEHETLNNPELIDKLEKLYTALNCTKIIVTSGFRCVEHDKSVGGSGTGQHTLGNAADICCYGQDGQPISSRTVCCKAQDIGFTGIANITAEYIYTHVDVRPNGKWYGDEVHGNGTVTDDFHKYFGSEDIMAKKGIDISLYQPDIDLSAVNADFAIIKAGEADFTDPLFEKHYANATAAGFPVGAYWYGQAKNIEEAKKEADCCIERLKGKQFAYPIYYDVEGDMLNLDSKTLSLIVKAFLERVEAAGYWVGLYMSGCPMHDLIEKSVLSRFAIWVADTRGVQPSTYLGADYGMWQYAWNGNINGIPGDVDMDYCYKDYPTKIKEKGLNGFGKPKPESGAESESGSEAKHIDVTVKVNDTEYSGTLYAK